MISNPEGRSKKSFRLFLAGYYPGSPGVCWHTRGYLPHCEYWDKVQSVTFRLADSLPKHVAEMLLRIKTKTGDDKEYRRQIESYLDVGYGECWLKRPEIALLVTDSLLHFHGERYGLHAWTIMPNHVHLMFEALPPFTLSRIIKDWKSFTAREINKLLDRTGQVWHEDFRDRYIRNEMHYHNCLCYIRQNPVKAGLVQDADAWPWSGMLKEDS